MNHPYNEEYYRHGCGPIPYDQPEHWRKFFGDIADYIVSTLHPRTVLDAGCAMGYLVAALRDRGVEAYGIDISDYAISKVRSDIRPYCTVASITQVLPDSLPSHYDLVITIEVLEHLSESDGLAAIHQLCQLSDTILFSSSPDDFNEPTHINVQPRAYWADAFLKEGFWDDLSTRPTYITLHASCFRRSQDVTAQVYQYETFVEDTENQLRETTARLTTAQESIVSLQNDIAQRNRDLAEMLKVYHEKCDSYAKLFAELEDCRQLIVQRDELIHNIQHSFSFRITRPLYKLKTFLFYSMDKKPALRKLRKAIGILRRKGISELIVDIKRYHLKKQELKKYGFGDGSTISNNKDGYLPYDSEYQDNQDFSSSPPDVKLLAFYLPQYHTFPENDHWWGTGFTEWTNVRRGTPRFSGHYQPRIPHGDIGYYRLDDISTMAKQAKLAKQHGIHGFCFYYYWFSGKRLMEKPVDLLLEHPEIDLPFCLCWANENWTRTWDGEACNVLIAQDYSEQDDDRFIRDLKPYLDDPRYIRVNGKPLVVVYNPAEIPNPRQSFHRWRQVAQEIGVGDILIWICQTKNNNASLLNITDCVDAEIQFPPHNLWVESLAVRDLDLHGKSALIYNYQLLVKFMQEKLKSAPKPQLPLHYTFMLSWDNAARRKNDWCTFYAFSLRHLYQWVLSVVHRTRQDFPPEERIAFVNAWNEWGEGTYLEPDLKYGYANINTVSKALLGLPITNDLEIISQESPACTTFDVGELPRIAVQVHMFYLDTLDETISFLNEIPYAFDCYFSTDTESKKQIILEKLAQTCHCHKAVVQVMENRGRDVAPFLVQMKDCLKQYDYICHIHSKKTKTGDYGDDWRSYNFRHLLGGKQYLQRMFYRFEQDPSLGIIFPETYPVLELQAEWGGNEAGVAALLERIGYTKQLPQTPVFPVGNMFWARAKAISGIFDLNLTQADFPEEAGQVNATIAHQIERAWIYAAAHSGYHYCKLYNHLPLNTASAPRKRLGIYVHFDKYNVISQEDVDSILTFSSLFTHLHVVSNSNLPKEEQDKILPMVSSLHIRHNVGYDFAAWRDMLHRLGRDTLCQYDEVILLNNSFTISSIPVEEMISTMDQKDLDFWGTTLFPFSPDGSYIHADCIPEHIQSYFMVFRASVVQSDTFWEFWSNIQDYNELIDVVAHCETQLTAILAKAGFTYGPYIQESYYISKYLNNYSIPYEKPTTLLLLRDPFIKKKCHQYMSPEESVKLQWLQDQFSISSRDEAVPKNH